MTFYLNISRLAEPVDFGKDETGRVIYALNFEAFKKESATFVEEVLSLLEAAEVGRREVDLFGTSGTTVPDGAGPFLVMYTTPGATRVRSRSSEHVRQSARFLVFAATSAAAKAMAHAARAALKDVRNQDVAVTEIPAA